MLACTKSEPCVWPKACYGMMELGTIVSSFCACPTAMAFGGSNCNEPTPAIVLFFVWVLALFALTTAVWVWTAINVWSKLQRRERGGAAMLFLASGFVLIAMAVHRIHTLWSMKAALADPNEPWQAGFYLFLSDTFLVFSNIVLMFDDKKRKGGDEDGALSRWVYKICFLFLPNAICLGVILLGNALQFENKEAVTSFGVGFAWLTLLLFVICFNGCETRGTPTKPLRTTLDAATDKPLPSNQAWLLA